MRPLPVKIFALSVLLILHLANARGDEPAWAWLHGPANTNCAQGIYGTQGVAAPGNRPGSRIRAATWTDPAGKLWLFGGQGLDGSNKDGRLNDLWRFDPATGCWTWIKGSDLHSQKAVYGTKGVSAPANTPGARTNPVTWTDAAGRLWLFGGMGVNDNNAAMAALNDLWRFDPATNEWTWMSGSTQFEQYGVYGAQGVADPANTPGAKNNAVSWTDHAGRFWLFGGSGEGRTASPSPGAINDLWCYDPATGCWTWVKGNDMPCKLGVYGTRGVEDPANAPDPRYGAVAWTDALGALWLYGGYAYGAATTKANLDDLWRFNPATGAWTWMAGYNKDQKAIYGTQGVADPANTPGYRINAVTWTDKSGMLWLCGGGGLDESGASGYMNDLWRLNPATLQWTWMKGDKRAFQTGTYQVLGGADPASAPAARIYAAAWTAPDGRLWMFGGYGRVSEFYQYRKFNDLWSFEPDTNNWAWFGGSINVTATMPVYEAKGVFTPSSATPGTRTRAATWTDAQGRCWLFGGLSENFMFHNDLWRLDPATGVWQWVKGGKRENQPGVYGVRGTMAPENTPGARSGAQTWTDDSGRLWLYGGGSSADLWRYDPDANAWTWVQGSSAPNQAPRYGAQGEADPANTPGSREGAVTWSDGAGRLWLFGGRDNNQAQRNDLWRYDPATECWTWVRGATSAGQTGLRGSPGVASPNNDPGARQGAVGWTDRNGCFWIYGGYSTSGSTTTYFGDLWRFEPTSSNWTWFKGLSTAENDLGPTSYGVRGMESTYNKPGPRTGSLAWTDTKGILWLFGGCNYDPYDEIYGESYGRMNDLWSFDPDTGNWAWRAGSKTDLAEAVPGPAGTASPAYHPGARQYGAAWCGKGGEVLIYSGAGYHRQIGDLGLADLWRLSPVALDPAPVILAQPQSLTINRGVTAVFSITTSGTQPLRYQWRRDLTKLVDDGRISGATSPTLAISEAAMNDSGFYTCDVTNATGSLVTSSRARLSINPVLTVYSAHGTARPAVGSYTVTSGTAITTEIYGSPEVDAAGTTRYVCTGWGMEDWLFTSWKSFYGTTTSFTTKVGTDRRLYWLWKTQYAITATATPPGGGRVTLADGVTGVAGSWFDANATVTLRAVPAAGYGFIGWGGDSTGAAGSTRLGMTRPRAVHAVFLKKPVIIGAPGAQTTVNPGAAVRLSVVVDAPAPLRYQWLKNGAPLADDGRTSGAATASLILNPAQFEDAGLYACLVSNDAGQTSRATSLIVNPTLTIVSAQGTPAPGVGTSVRAMGAQLTVTAPAQLTDTAGTTRWVCTGWTGTGSAPAQGSTNSLTVKLTMPTTVTWQWRKQYKLGVTASPAAAGKATLADGVTAAQGWRDADQPLTLKAIANAGYLFVRWTGDQPGRTNPISVRMNRPMTLGVQFRDRNTAVRQWENFE